MPTFHGTTILALRHGGKVVVAGDGQVSLGQTVMKRTARKVRRIYGGKVLAGFAGSAADSFALFERFEAKLEQHRGNLERSAVELAKDWRTDRALRRLEAMLVVVDRKSLFLLSGNGDLIEPDEGIVGIGSGGGFAQAAAKALGRHTELGERSRAHQQHRGLAAFVQDVHSVDAAQCGHRVDHRTLRVPDRGGPVLVIVGKTVALARKLRAAAAIPAPRSIERACRKEVHG